MNKSHRIVWSDARNAFIVAGENAAAKGKPSSVRKVLAAAVAALFMGPGLAAAQSSCAGQNPVSDAQTSTQCYANVDVTVASGGSVEVSGSGTVSAVDVQAAPYARDFVNQGALGADASGYGAHAYGAQFRGRVSGSVVNAATGTVSVSTLGQGGDYADAYGLLIGGDLGGDLANAGTIEVSAENMSSSSSYAYAGAYGIGIAGDVDGTVTNTGNIRTESAARSSGGSYYYSQTDAESVRIGGSLNGAISNSGVIEAHATMGVGGGYYNDYARAYGISISDDLGGSLQNTGTIRATAERGAQAGSSNYSDYLWAVGVHVGDDVSGSVLNSGEILAHTTVEGSEQYGYANAYGVRAYGVMSGTIENTGTIHAESVRASADSSSSYTKAYGVVTGDLVGELKNSGSIVARSEIEEGYAHAYAYGVSTYYSDLIGTVRNDGEIVAEVVSEEGYAGAYGVGVGRKLTGTLQNNGQVSARAEADNARTRGVSVRDGDLFGLLDNRGTVAATSITQDGYAKAAGIVIGDDDDDGKISGTLRNTGAVLATAIAQGSEETEYRLAAAMDESPEPAEDVMVSAGETIARGIGAGLVSSNGRVDNSGRVLADARSEAVAQAAGEAYAGTDDADAAGIELGAVDGAFSNTSTVAATAMTSAVATGDEATARSAEAFASGVGFSGAGGSFDNSGTITARASSSALANGTSDGSVQAEHAEALGVWIEADGPGVHTGRFSNSGTIQAEASTSALATGEYAYAESYGGALAVGVLAEEVDGHFDNAGLILASSSVNVKVNGESVEEVGGASAVGVLIENGLGANAVLNNSGTISALADGVGTGVQGVAGVVIGADVDMGGSEPSLMVSTEELVREGLFGTLDNSGVITAEGRGGIDSAAVFSVIASGGTGTINNLRGGVIAGRLSVGGEINVNNAGVLDIRDTGGMLGAGGMVPAGAFGMFVAANPLPFAAGSHVGGDYTQAASGELKIAVAPVLDEDGVVVGNRYGTLHVGGAAVLAEGTGIRVMVDPASTIVAGDVLQDVIYAEGEITRGAVRVMDNVLALNFTAMSDDSPYDLDLKAVSTGLTTVNNALGAAGLRSAAGAGGVLAGLMDSGDAQPGELGDFLFQLGGAGSAGEVANQVATLLPLASGGVTTATLGALQGAGRVVQARVDSNLGRSSGDGFMGDKRVWLKGFGSWAEQDARSGASGYDADTAGLAVGVDAVVTDTNRVGVLFAYSETEVDGTGAARQSADVDTYQLGLYGSHTLDESTDINGMIGFGRHSTDGSRQTVGGVASSSYDSKSFMAGIGVARSYPLSEQTILTPSVRLDYTRVKDDAYQEQGAGALNLSVDKNTVSELVLSLDGKVTHKLSDTLVFVGHAGVGYDFENEQSSITATLAGAPGAAFVTKGVDPSPWLVRAGLGLVNTPAESWEVSARYEVEGRSDFLNHTAWLRARKAF